eukprot:g64139.t1
MLSKRSPWAARFTPPMLDKIFHSLAMMRTMQRRYIDTGDVPVEWKRSLFRTLSDPECRFVSAHLPPTHQKQLSATYKKLDNPEMSFEAWARLTGLDYIRSKLCCPISWVQEYAELTTLRMNRERERAAALEAKLAKTKASMKVLRVQAGHIGSESDGEKMSDSEEDDEDEDESRDPDEDPKPEEQVFDNPFRAGSNNEEQCLERSLAFLGGF